jgi:hypothetical protein
MLLAVLAVIALAVGGIQAVKVVTDAEPVAPREERAGITEIELGPQEGGLDDPKPPIGPRPDGGVRAHPMISADLEPMNQVGE